MNLRLPDLDHCGEFPSVNQALDEPDGLLCMGGDLSVKRLLRAYQQGIFPWYNEDDPILWWSPAHRMVLPPANIHVSRSLSRAINKLQPHYFINRNFETVISQCALIKRSTPGRWIHDDMIDAYCDLFKAGNAFCIEVEVGHELVGGLYGVKTPHVFSGESMFSLTTNGSKLAMVALSRYLQSKQVKLLDCQLYNDHLDSMGARLIPRDDFIKVLEH